MLASSLGHEASAGTSRTALSLFGLALGLGGAFLAVLLCLLGGGCRLGLGFRFSGDVGIGFRGGRDHDGCC